MLEETKKVEELKENLETPENAAEVKKSEKYKWIKDKKIIGTIILILSVAFQLFAFLQVPFFSTIHGYTVGMLLGWYNPFFYFFVAYLGLVLIFGDKVKPPKWIKLNYVTYWIVAISITFIGLATGYYQTKDNWTVIGPKAWDTFNTWFDDFRDGGSYGAWTPANTNGGVIGVFLYSFFTMISSGIGSFIVAVGSLALTVSYMVTGSSIGFYKNLINKRKIALQQKEIKVEGEDEKVATLLTEVKASKLPDIEDPFASPSKPEVAKEKPQNIVKKESVEETKKDEFPFDDPFNV